MIDAHSHLYFEQFDADRNEVLKRSRESGVRALINVGIDETTSQKAIEMSEAHQNVFATVGLHPHSAHLIQEDLYPRLEKLAASSKKVVAIGEVGLDYFKSEADHEVQKHVFSQMAALALRTKLPLVVHSREAYRDTVKVLYRHKKESDELEAVFHCYSYDDVGLEAILDMGFLVSFTCNATYPNAHGIRKAVAKVPLDRFMIETDCPYLAPQAKRGKRNEPSFLTYLVEAIAQTRQITPEEVRRWSFENTKGFFRLSLDK